MGRMWAPVLVFVALGIGTTLAQAQTKGKKTVWVDPPMGSHIGGGYTDAGEDANASNSKLATVQENTTLGTAVASLDARAGTIVDGYALLPTAVSWQTKVSVEVLKKQRATSGLTYGQLLVANSLATGSGKSFDQVLALKKKGQNWTQLAGTLHVGVGSIVARVKAADGSLKYAETRRKLRRDQNLNATDLQRDERSRSPAGG